MPPAYASDGRKRSSYGSRKKRKADRCTWQKCVSMHGSDTTASSSSASAFTQSTIHKPSVDPSIGTENRLDEIRKETKNAETPNDKDSNKGQLAKEPEAYAKSAGLNVQKPHMSYKDWKEL